MRNPAAEAVSRCDNTHNLVRAAVLITDLHNNETANALANAATVVKDERRVAFLSQVHAKSDLSVLSGRLFW
jgi:hypothetical protein